VESFLKNLRLRGCNFQVAFFDNQSELCAPLAAPASVRSKYRMTRAILIQHLSRCANGINSDVGTGFIFSFPSIASDDFYSHLAQNPAIFLLCHDGHDTSGHHSPHQAPFQYMIHEFLRLGHSVALIHSTEFKSSRVGPNHGAWAIYSSPTVLQTLTRIPGHRIYDNGSWKNSVPKTFTKLLANSKCTKIASSITTGLGGLPREQLQGTVDGRRSI
jgi:hypothetical protein